MAHTHVINPVELPYTLCGTGKLHTYSQEEEEEYI